MESGHGHPKPSALRHGQDTQAHHLQVFEAKVRRRRVETEARAVKGLSLPLLTPIERFTAPARRLDWETDWRIWSEEVTEGKGLYWNCNARSYRHKGIEMLHPRDAAKTEVFLRRVVSYLTKTTAVFKFSPDHGQAAHAHQVSGLGMGDQPIDQVQPPRAVLVGGRGKPACALPSSTTIAAG